jgi:hypothetical protein
MFAAWSTLFLLSPSQVGRKYEWVAAASASWARGGALRPNAQQAGLAEAQRASNPNERFRIDKNKPNSYQDKSCEVTKFSSSQVH